MLYPPQGYQPKDRSGSIRNGSPCKASDAIEVDHYQTYLATRPHCVPAFVADAYDAGYTYKMIVPVPAWRESLRFRVLASGVGTVTFTSADDTYNCVLTFSTQSGATVHTIADAGWRESGPAMTVDANGENRALDVDDQSDPADLVVTMVLADGSGSGDHIKVYTVQPFYEWHSTAAVLPA